MSFHDIYAGDCFKLMAHLPDNSIDLVLCSPPYEAARTYGIDFKLKGQEWVDWAVWRYLECLRVCKGLVAWVVEGQTRRFQWSATPALFMADLHRQGVKLRKPPIYKRRGIPGSGGPDWLQNCYEFIVCGTKDGRLPWSCNTAMGHPPKFPPGGDPSHRTTSGARVNADWPQNRRPNGDREKRRYRPPAMANPGNIIDCGSGGGGQLGSELAHENEAPFPEKLAEFFIKSFCPEGGTVLDPFCGSGTTCAVAKRFNRNSVGFDIRPEMAELTKRRLAQEPGE